MTGLRRWYRLDEPEAHPTPPQLALALVLGLASACLWGWLVRLWFVFGVTLFTAVLTAWLTPAARERPLERALNAFSQGAVWALFGSLAMGRSLFG